jgi:hypothetical protein
MHSQESSDILLLHVRGEHQLARSPAPSVDREQSTRKGQSDDWERR